MAAIVFEPDGRARRAPAAGARALRGFGTCALREHLAVLASALDVAEVGAAKP